MYAAHVSQRPIRVDFNAHRHEYRRIQVKPRQPGFGAYVQGIDLARGVDAETAAELKDAWMRYSVLFLEPQQITAEQQLTLASILGGGVQEGSVRRKVDGLAQVELLVHDENRPPDVNAWHTDLSWQKTLPLGTAIQITELPEVGGDTVWASMHKAYDYLSAPMQQMLEQLTAIHSWENSTLRTHRLKEGEDSYFDMFRRFPPVEHPVVKRHPVTGRKALFVNEMFTTHIPQLQFRESAALLTFLFDWARQPEFLLQHHWEKNGIAIWDNYATQHYAQADYYPARRVNRRVLIKGDFDLADASK